MAREPILKPPVAEKDDDRDLRPNGCGRWSGSGKSMRGWKSRSMPPRNAASRWDTSFLTAPPGLGKTTFATCIPRELGVMFQIASGATLAAPKDVIPYLTNAEERSVLFIDEIHRLPKAVEEFLYPAMEDFRIDLTLGEGVNARTHQYAAETVHADRGHHAHRAAVGPASRPVSHARTSGFLHRRGTGRNRAAQRQKAAGGDRRRRGRGNRRPQPRHAPAGQ